MQDWSRVPTFDNGSIDDWMEQRRLALRGLGSAGAGAPGANSTRAERVAQRDQRRIDDRRRMVQTEGGEDRRTLERFRDEALPDLSDWRALMKDVAEGKLTYEAALKLMGGTATRIGPLAELAAEAPLLMHKLFGLYAQEHDLGAANRNRESLYAPRDWYLPEDVRR